jgi:fibronectin-binding autotransporter adhesin
MKASLVHLKAFLALVMTAPSVHSAVVTTTSDSGAGSLRAAVTNASAGEVITFAAALAGQTVTVNEPEIIVARDVTIDGASGVLIMGKNINNASGNIPKTIRISQGVAMRSINLTFSGASSLWNEGTLTASNCVFTNGGAIWNVATGNGSISDSKFYSAGILNEGALSVNNCEFHEAPLSNYGELIMAGGAFRGDNSVLSSESAFAPIYNARLLRATNVVFASNKGARAGVLYSEGKATLHGCRLTANLGREGGAIYNAGELSAINCDIDSNNASAAGGGIFCATGTASLVSCTIKTNSSLVGGAIYKSSGVLTLDRCVVIGNVADSHSLAVCAAAGIYNHAGALTINDSTITRNQVGEWYVYGPPFQPGLPPRMIFYAGNGGGLYSDGGKVSLKGCTVSFNKGSGLFQYGSDATPSLTIQNCTIVSNTAGAGGAIYSAGAALQIEHSTIVGNTASGAGGIYCAGFTLLNSIVAQNNAPASADVSGNFTGSNNLVSVDPKLGPLGDFGGPTLTMPPLSGSPAEKAGAVTSLQYDQRGVPHRTDGPPDIGAVEIDASGFGGELIRIIRMKRMASGALEIMFKQSRVLASPTVGDLNAWVSLGPGTNTPPGSDLYRLEDKNPELSQRFYRLMAQ